MWTNLTQIQRKQIIDTDRDTLWKFMSDPNNLGKITPEWMLFKITSKPEKNMYAGMIITYKVTPILNIPMKWVTEITHMDKGNFFIDVQRFGPYKFWHHQHVFLNHPKGVLMKDIITYAPPLSLFGTILNNLIIKKRINKIFDYREREINKIFNSKSEIL